MFKIFGEIFNIRLKIELIFDNIILDICLLPAIFILALTIHYVYSFSYWKRRNIIFIPPKFPFGSVPLLAQEKQNFNETFADIYKSTLMMREKLMGFFIFTKPVLLIADLDIIENILVKDFDKFQTRGLYYNADADPLAGHLVNFHAGKWKRIRSKLIFTPDKMRKMFEVLLQCSFEIERVMDDTTNKTHQSIDIHDILDRFTIDNISSSVFGLNSNSMKPSDSEFRKYGQILFNTTIMNAVKFLAAIRFPKLLQILKHSSEVTNFFKNIFKQTAECRNRTKLKRTNFIDLFIKLKNNENFDDIIDDCTKNLDEEISSFNAQAFVLFATGYETSSNTINHCLFELATDANIQDKLREEIKDTLKKHHGQLTYDGIMEMKYLKKVVDETLRKYPPFPIIRRECNETYSVPNTNIVIERGIQIWISTLGIHKNPDIYQEPNKFDPERFSEVAISSRHPSTYLPFGNGPRNCIGMRFGYLQIKIGIIALLKNYKYTLDPKMKIPSNTRGIPKDKIWLRVEKLC